MEDEEDSNDDSGDDGKDDLEVEMENSFCGDDVVEDEILDQEKNPFWILRFLDLEFFILLEWFCSQQNG